MKICLGRFHHKGEGLIRGIRENSSNGSPFQALPKKQLKSFTVYMPSDKIKMWQ